MHKPKIILGLNILHPDSSACLYIGKQLVGAIAEERLGKRIKHDLSFPVNSIRYLLEKSHLKVKDIDYVAVARDPSANKIQKLNSLFLSQRNKISAVKVHGCVFSTIMLLEIMHKFLDGFEERERARSNKNYIDTDAEQEVQNKYSDVADKWNKVH